VDKKSKKFERLSPIERAREINRAFFRANPHRRVFIRPYIEGELPDELGVIVPKGSFVRVTQIGPGLRISELIFPSEKVKSA
jgi:hypothetical protein